MKDPKVFLPDTTVNKMDIISGDDDIFQAGADTPLNPGGGLISSMSDWSKFVQMFLNNGRSTNGTQIISPESIDLMSKKSTKLFLMIQQVRKWHILMDEILVINIMTKD